jgi:hypothetical protein
MPPTLSLDLERKEVPRMSRRVLIVAVVVAVMLATLVAPAVAVPLEAGDTVPVSTTVQSGFSDGSWVAPRPPIHINGGGGCSGAGSCPS